LETQERWTPPYGIPWSTMLHAVEKMAQDGLPNRIDRSYLGNLSGNVQTYLIAAFKSFGLIADEGNTVLPPLKELAANEHERPALVANLLRTYYPKVVELGQTNATLDELADLFEAEYGVKGATRIKAIRFYLNAAVYAGVQTSPLWKASRGGAGAPSTPKPKPRLPRPRGKQPQGAGSAAENRQDGHTYTVALGSGGGVVGLSVSVNLFELSVDDRNFVIDLVDKMKGYNGGRPPATDAADKR
jgi:hypothetical protein